MPTLFLALTTAVDCIYSTGIMENSDAITREDLGTCELSTLGTPRMKRERLHPAGRLVAIEEDMVEWL